MGLLGENVTRERGTLKAITVMLLALGLVAPVSQAAIDPLFDEQWGLAQIHAPEAWATATGAGVTVAVIDTGIDFAHPDLAGKIVGGITFDGCGSTGCGDGSKAPGFAGSPHGTWVAGVIAATAGNGIGIAGVAPEASLLSVNVGGVLVSDVALGIEWAVDHGADVINLSLGRAGFYGTELLGTPDELSAALFHAYEMGVVVIAASGNHPVVFLPPFPPDPFDPYYPHVPVICADPASRPDVICVGATDKRELPAYYSGLPVREEFSALAAPGGAGLQGFLGPPGCDEAVVTTHPTDMPKMCPFEGSYEATDGTSFAAPHVAGVAALLVSMGCDLDEVRGILLNTARHPGLDARGLYSPVYGHGIVDAAAAVSFAADVCAG